MGKDNPVLEAIAERRSVRKFQGARVEREVVSRVIEAGNSAPSPGNGQKWRFVVIQGLDALSGVRNAGRPIYQKIFDGFHDPVPPFFAGPYAKSRGWRAEGAADFQMAAHEDPDLAFYGAPVMIVVVATSDAMAGTGCPMVCLNMMLAAHSLGLGSLCTTSGNGAFEEPPGKGFVDLAEGESIVACVLIGKPAITPEPPPKNPAVIKWV